MEFAGQKVSVAPVTYPVTVAELRSWMLEDGDWPEARLNAAIGGAIDEVEARTRRAYVPRTIEQTFTQFSSCMELLFPPAISVTSISYYDTDGASQTLSSAVYQLDTHAQPGNVSLALNQSWPATQSRNDAVTITYRAGYAIDGALTSALTAGAITAITVDGLATVPPKIGKIILDSSETVSYTTWSVAGSTYTFTVAATLANSYSNDDPVEVLTIPLSAEVVTKLIAADFLENSEGQVAGTIISENRQVKTLIMNLRIADFY
jgi:uncharacterized phiE125 gp8 family phage protein